MPSPLLTFLERQLDALLAACPDDHARVVFLARQYGNWQAKRARFVTASREDLPLPGEFDFGAYGGHLQLSDFVLILGLIDRKKREIDAREAAHA